jgi:hypothetical protein
MNRYKIDANYLKGHEEEIEKGEVELEVRLQDTEDMSWNLVRALISKKPFEGGEKGNIMSRYGKIGDEVYIKIME